MMENVIPVYDISALSDLQNDDIFVSRLAAFSEAHGELHNPHRHNFFHITMFTTGDGEHSIDFQTLHVKPYQICFMIPGQVHSWNFKSGVDGYVINFSPAFFDNFLIRSNFVNDFKFFDGNIQDSVIQIPHDLQGKIVSLFEDMISEGPAARPFDTDLIRILLLHILILISRVQVPDNQPLPVSYNYTLLNNFQKLIGKNYTTHRLPKEYAALLYITPNHLNALCNDLLGISAGEVIRNRVFLEAKRLLINPELTITEISNRLNFTDNSYFSKAFKKHTGDNPEEFRRKTLTMK